MRVNSNLRETAEHRPNPTGDFDGQTRAQALKALLDQHYEAEAIEMNQVDPRVRRTIISGFGMPAKRLAAILGFTRA